MDADGDQKARLGAWTWLFLSPGLALAIAGTAFLLSGEHRREPSLVACALCWALLGCNALPLAFAGVRRRAWAMRREAALMAGALAVGLIVAEAFCQLALDTPPLRATAPAYRDDPELGFALLPGIEARLERRNIFRATCRINSRGVRGPEWPDQATTTVLALGCSQTFGFGVNAGEAWPERLQERLGKGALVINGGVPAYGPSQMLLLGRRLAAERRPDVVLAAFQFHHLARLGLDDAWNASLAQAGRRTPLLGIRQNDAGAEEIVIERLVPEEVIAQPEPVGGEAIIGADQPPVWLWHFVKVGLKTVGNALDYALFPSHYADAEGLSDPQFERQLENFALAIRGLADLSRQTGARGAALLLPEPERVGQPDYERFREALKDLCAKHGLEFWEMSPRVHELTGGASLVISRLHERHYNPRAHDAIAQAVAERLASSSMLKN